MVDDNDFYDGPIDDNDANASYLVVHTTMIMMMIMMILILNLHGTQ